MPADKEPILGSCPPSTAAASEEQCCASEPPATHSTTVDSATVHNVLIGAQTTVAEPSGSYKRGRPRKPKEDGTVPKRPRGRPRKLKELVIGPKRPRGRPRKQDTPATVSIELKKIVSTSHLSFTVI